MKFSVSKRKELTRVPAFDLRFIITFSNNNHSTIKTIVNELRAKGIIRKVKTFPNKKMTGLICTRHYFVYITSRPQLP